MQELLQQYQNHLRHNLGNTAETVVKYVGNLRIIFDELNIENLEDINAGEINQKWLDDLWNIMQNRRGLSDSTVRIYQSSLKKFIVFLEKNELIAPGTAGRIDLAKPSHVHIEGLSHEAQKQLREYLANSLQSETGCRNAALISFMWSTGCRISEAIALDVHGDGYIYTDNPLTRSGSFSISEGDVYVHINGKGKRNRNIPVAVESVAYINYYLENRETRRSSTLFMGCANNHRGERLTRGGANFALKGVFADIGIQKPVGVCSHILRHTAIEHWIKSGFSAMEIISMTGHSSAKELEPYYRRSRDLTRVFAHEGNTMAKFNKMNKKLRTFEAALKSRHARGVNE